MQNYSDTISKPTFLAQERMKDKEVFLNGEVNSMPARLKQGNDQQMIRKTQVCLKGIMVDNQLAREALKNYYNL